MSGPIGSGTEDPNSNDEESLESLPAVGGNDPPMDIDSDGLYEDIDGNGEADIFDVQTLYDNLDTSAVQDNAEVYNFSDGDPTEVTILDVQELYNQITSSSDWELRNY